MKVHEIFLQISWKFQEILNLLVIWVDRIDWFLILFRLRDFGNRHWLMIGVDVNVPNEENWDGKVMSFLGYQISKIRVMLLCFWSKHQWS